MQKKVVIYIHGKGGNANEAERFKQLFPEYEVLGFDYIAQTPWEAQNEFTEYFKEISNHYSSIILIANSIGAFFAIHALKKTHIEKAYFISPIVNMDELITKMIQWAGVSEAELKERGIIETDFGETLSWEYLSWVRNHQTLWKVPTSILYGGNDNLQSIDAIRAFAVNNAADITLMEKGEHWFHTEEQLKFLNNWICRVAV